MIEILIAALLMLIVCLLFATVGFFVGYKVNYMQLARNQPKAKTEDIPEEIKTEILKEQKFLKNFNSYNGTPQA